MNLKRFDDNARVCFVGDSITASGKLAAFVFDYYIKNLPDARVKIFNTGVAGDSARGALKRLKSDVLRYNPTEVVLMFGMNDVSRDCYLTDTPNSETTQKREERAKRHSESVFALCAEFEKLNIPVTLCSSTPVDEVFDLPTPHFYGLNCALRMLYRNNLLLTKEFNLKNTVNFGEVMDELLCEVHELGGSSFIGKDRVHPQLTGYYIMARLFLRAQGFLDVEMPSAKRIIDGSISLPELTIANQNRLVFEQDLRDIAFIDYHIQWGQEQMSLRQKIDYWTENADIFGQKGPTHKRTSHRYIETKERETEIFNNLLLQTDLCVKA